MDFFILNRDNRIQSPIKLNAIPNFFESGMGQQLEKDDLSASAFLLNESRAVELTDFIFFDISDTAKHRGYQKYMVISNKLQPVFSKYNPPIAFKPFAFINSKEKQQHMYWLCKVETVVRADKIEDATLYPQLIPHYNSRIIRLELQNESKFIVTLEVLESILKYGALGIAFRKIKP